jgi:WD40 repeat protein/energy-coupling factor transporter ATP-binding protein EcfA2
MTAARRHAFIVGINRYGKNTPALGSAVRDAEAVARVLADVHGYEVDLHLDEQATLEKLRALFDGLPARVGEDDRAVIYFAGHGIAESGGDADGPRGYFVPQDADRDRIETFLPMIEVQRYLDALKCKHLLVLLDCCFAGAFKWSKTRGMGGRPKKLYKERYERYLREPARQVLTSASSNETALDVVSGKVLGTRDVGEGHSPFAMALISALRDAVADIGLDGEKGDGVTTATELHFYIERVMARVEQDSGRAVQKPMLWQIDDRGQGGEFLFETPGRQPDLPSALVLSEENNPYRGLQSYDEQHAAMFFGRQKLTEQLAEAVAGQSLTLVVGASGSGKSSLVKAGLVHHLRQSAKRWAIVPPVRPGTSPMHALEVAARAMEAWSPDGGEVAPPSADAPVPTLAGAVRALAAREPALELLVIVDQLEELVTMAPPGDERTRFFASLADARAAGLRLVCTLRADFEPHFLDLARDNPGARFPVRPMNREELREVIEGPARDRVLEFDPPSLVDALIDEVIDSPGALPLLSFTLSELYRERLKRDAADRALSEVDYGKLGGVTGALGTRADKIYDGQPDEAAKQTMARVLLRLVSLKGGEAAKRRLPRRELVSTDPEETARAERIVKELSEARLVVEGREDDPRAQPAPAGPAPADAGAYVEAAHDKLVTGWTRLWEILAEHRDDLQLLRSCTDAAGDWEGHGLDPARLWNADPRLPQLEALQKKDRLGLNALETRFVAQSGRRRRNIRLAVGASVVAVIAGLSVALVFALVARTAALSAREQAKESEQKAIADKKLAEEAEKSAQQARRRALLSRLVAEAGRPDKDVTQEQALLLSVEAERRLAELPLAVLPTDAAMRRVQDRTAATEKILRYATNLGVSGLAWSPASPGRRLLAASGADKSVALWSPDTGAELSRLAFHDGVDEVRWSPVGEHLLAHTGWWHDWTLLANKGDSLREQASYFVDDTKVQSVAWSPDGKLALVVSTSQALVWSADRATETGRIQVDDLQIAEGHLLPGGKSVLLCGKVPSSKRGHAGIYAIEPAAGRPAKPARVLVDDADDADHCAVSADGEWFAVTAKNGVDLWSNKPAPPRRLQAAGGVAVLAFDHQSRYLAAGTNTGAAELWSVRSEPDRSRLEGHTAGLASVQWSDDDNRLLTSSADGTAIVWDTTYSTKVVALSGHDGPLTGAAWDPTDATRVATSSEDGTVRIFRLGRRDPPTFGASHHGVVDAACSPSADLIAIADGEGVVTIRPVADAAAAEVRHFGGGADKVVTVRYCPDGASLVTRDARGGVKLWAADTGALKRAMTGTADPDSTPTCSHDGQLVGAFEKKRAIVWDAATGARAETTYESRIVDPVWHPRKSVAALRVWAFTGQVRLIGPAVGAAPTVLEGNVDGVYEAAWSHDGARLVTGDNGSRGGQNGVLHLYDAALDRAGDHPGGPTRDIAQPGNDKTFSIAWSPDDRSLVTGGTDAGRVWDTTRWTLISTLPARELHQVAWSPRGDRIAAVDEHGALSLFLPGDGALVAEPTFGGRAVKSATWTHDGARLLVRLSDETARLITVYREDLALQLCRRAVRNFTRAEWTRYLGEDEPYRATCEELPIEPAPAGDAGAP